MSQVFFYKAWIMRADRRVCKEGTIQAKFPQDGLDLIVGLAVNEWKRPLLRVELYEVGVGGDLVATSSVSDRIDAVLDSHKGLDTGKLQNMRERREKLKQSDAAASHRVKTIVPERPAPQPGYHTWPSEIGKYETAPNFATLKLKEGAFK